MILLAAITIAVLFGAGTMLLMRTDLLRALAGTMLLSNAAILFILLSAPTPAEAPVHPIAAGTQISDPLVQALALTAVVINLGFTALLLALVYRVYRIHRTIDPVTLGRHDTGRHDPIAGRR